MFWAAYQYFSGLRNATGCLLWRLWRAFGIACCIVFFYLFKNLWGTWENQNILGDVKIWQEHNTYLQPTRDFYCPATRLLRRVYLYMILYFDDTAHRYILYLFTNLLPSTSPVSFPYFMDSTYLPFVPVPGQSINCMSFIWQPTSPAAELTG